MPFMDLFHNIKKPISGVLVIAVALLLMATIEQAAARFGGFRGGGFGGFRGGDFGGFRGGDFRGGRFGDGGFYDRSADAGFGRGGWGSINHSEDFTSRADSFRSSHPEFSGDAKQLQQNRFNEANSLQQNRFNEANHLQNNRENDWNDWDGPWGGYYAGLGLGAGFAVGAAFASLPASVAAISVAGAPYWYANGVYYAMQAGKYVVVPPPEGAVVTTPPSSCSVIYAGDSPKLDCGGAFYAHVANGYQVIPPPIGSTVTRLPNGAVSENIEGVAYFRFGDAYYRPFYSGSSAIYEVVTKPG
jgi:Family of unknown function (DUF6515)